ncbi:hypothetical protein VE01_03036 [Pseudogymnoascus verrucosus]|uniref:WW domain-containing protein n=1 Tax=Pseudogymnoascus verrucosus TaxID=342668 RepID=A0A1B8GR95_9PEZI|nr:uncharacterized protein VE01_03036 [Pseudogymnoascus verrucosus]OBT98355.1 hypothetical protein VE01_03036 [Pseudogymnoascus verrucosus]
MANTRGILSAMKLYEYKSLETVEEIRLLTILPGQFEDDLQIEIHHALLQLPDAAPTQRLPINQLQETLLDGWRVFETIDCKYLFWGIRTGETSWHHPNPRVSRMLYAPLPNYPDDTFMPEYEVLSSTWGDKTQQAEITVVNAANALEEHSKIEMQFDLADAIRQLRLTDRTRTLWVDMICIDHNNKSEKAMQAKCIGRVYALASVVIVWLSHRGDSAALGLETLAKLGGEIQYTMDDFCFPTPQTTYPEWVKENTAPPFTIVEWIGVVDLLRLAWFQQRWSWQEIQLGNRNRVMICGESARSWATVRRAIMALYGLTRCFGGGMLEVHGLVCGSVESIFTPGWIPEDISRLSALLQMLRDLKPVAKRLQDCNIDLIDELVSILCDCFTKDRLPDDASVWDQQEVRNLLDAALGGGDSNGPFDVNLWTRLKVRNQGHSLIVSHNGLIGKVGDGREMVRAGDMITTVLGRNSSLILRPAGDDAYVVITGALVPSLCDSVSILSPLPDGWKIKLIDDRDHPQPQPHYTNNATNETTREDPRLGPLPPGWIRVQGEWQHSQPIFVEHFQNVMTGEVVHWDLRLDADALRDRGVAIKTFLLK